MKSLRQIEHCRKLGLSSKGHIVSDETRKKISEANKGRKVIGRIVSEEGRRKLSEAHKGKPWTKAKREAYDKNPWGHKISLACKGRVRSKETRAKMSKSQMGHKNNLGKTHSIETRLKISRAIVGKRKNYKHSAETRLKISATHNKNKRNVGKIQTPEIRMKHSLALRGNNAPNWKGGVTLLNKLIRESFIYRQWRSDIFTRDNFTCQHCGVRGGILQAHHIKLFSVIVKSNQIKTLEQALDCAELWNINNGATLCKECHKKINWR